MEKITIRLYGMVDCWGYLSSELKYNLQRHADKEVTLLVNSLGGDVNEAMKISELIASHGNVTVRFTGCNASASTWMVFGAKTIETVEDGLFLIHKCSNMVYIAKSMKIEDIDAKIKELESMKKSQEAFNLTIAKKYFDRAAGKGKSFEDICQLMEEERWITAEDAMKWGLVDKIIPGVNRMSKDAQNTIANYCSAHDLPVPQFLPYNEDKSVVAQILEGVKKLLKPENNQVHTQADNMATVDNETFHLQNAGITEDMSNKNKFSMHKAFVNLCGLLAIDASAQTDEKKEVTLTVDQLQAIEDALAEATNQRTELESVVESLDAVSDNIKTVTGAKNKALALATLVQNFPGSSPSGKQVPSTLSDKKEAELKDIAKDPINGEMANYYSLRNRKK